jgi:hypothetical protein
VEDQNGFEGYCFGIENSIIQDQFSQTLSSSDKEQINREINDEIAWIDQNEEADVAVLELKQGNSKSN